MSTSKTKLEQTISKLKQQRDELALQIHLGAAEAKEEFENAKKQLEQMTEEYAPLKDAVEQSAGEVFVSKHWSEVFVRLVVNRSSVTRSVALRQ